MKPMKISILVASVAQFSTTEIHLQPFSFMDYAYGITDTL